MSFVSLIYKHPKKSRIVIFSFVYLLVMVMLAFLYKNYEYNIRRTGTETELLSGIREIKNTEFAYQNVELSYRSSFIEPQSELNIPINKAQDELTKQLAIVTLLIDKTPAQKERLNVLTQHINEQIRTLDDLLKCYSKGEKNQERLLNLSRAALKNYYVITNTLEEMTVSERKDLYVKVEAHKIQDSNILRFYLFVGFCFSLAMLPLFLLVNHLLIKDGHQRELYAKNACLLKKLKKQQLENEQLESDYEFFCYSVSHDLRAPIRAIQGFTNLITDPSTSEEEKKRYLSVIVKESDKMSGLIDSLLEFTKTGRKELVKTSINTGKLVQDVIDSIPNKDPKTVITVGSLPKIEADYILITQVFFNLIENALKFSFEKENPSIEIGYQKDTFFVKDNGVGFSNKYADKIFGLFQRLYPDKEYKGSGAGLSIAKKIVERHGGKIWAEGEVGTGATFYFNLP